jgi:hypothetical protein
MNTSNDDVIQCGDCGVGFIVTAGEHQIYATRGHCERQRYCRRCRVHRREQIAAAVVTKCPPGRRRRV